MSQYQVQDRYFKKAKETGFRARSAFKLADIQKRYHFLKSGQAVLDLGAAPGSFLQYIAGIIGEKGLVVGIDLQEIKDFPERNIQIFQGDIYDAALMERIVSDLRVSQFDVITSDLAPKTSGIKFMDGGASLELNLQVLEIAKKYLKKKGVLVMKVLPGFNEGDLLSPLKKMFGNIKKIRPEAVRDSSKERYIVALDKISK